MTVPKHFLEIDDFDRETLVGMVDRARALKSGTDGLNRPLAGKTLAMIFEKPSTRTRVSFEVGMRQLGGDVVVLSAGDMQIGRGETIADTARVLSRYVDVIMLRTDSDAKLKELAEHATVPVINGLSDQSHPCQLMADIMTFEERRGSIRGRTVTWMGDGNNMSMTWIQAAALFNFSLRIAGPEALAPPQASIDAARHRGGDIVVTTDPDTAVDGADLVLTDCWVSMNQEDAGDRHNLLAPYRVDDRLMARAATDALFMHCLPAHRGEEVTASVIDGPQSVVWDEAENRLHAQKAILTWCLTA